MYNYDMKIVGSKKAVRTPQFHERQERIKKIKITLWIILAVLLLIAPFVILRNKHLLISKIHLVGNVVTTEDDIEAVVNEDLSGNYFYLVPKASSLFYSKKKIQEDLLRTFPRLSQAVVTLESPSAITITMLERRPEALYCKDVSKASSPSGCYFLDDQGYIFALAPVFSGAIYDVYTTDPLLDDPLKTQLFPANDFKGLQNFWQSLHNIPLTPAVLTLKNDEYDLTLESGTVVKWRKNQSLDTTYSSLDSFIADPSVRKKGINNLLYIDLRVDDKAYYKFQGE
jgi:cell division septal protein FtsQ